MNDCGYMVRILGMSDIVADSPAEIDYFGMSLCVGGGACVTINMVQYIIGEGDILFFAPKDIVRMEGMTEDFALKQICVTSMDLIREAATHIYPFMKDEDSSRAFFLSERDSYSKGKHVPKAFCTIYDFLSLVLSNEESACQYEQGVCIFRCLLLMLREKSTKRRKKSMFTGAVGSMGLFNRFMVLLNEHVKMHHEVEFYADELHITAQYLSRICKKNDGRTAKRIINDSLILLMKSSLKNTEKTMKEICYEYNFPTFSFMSSFFRRYVGVTPSKFREEYRNNRFEN